MKKILMSVGLLCLVLLTGTSFAASFGITAERTKVGDGDWISGGDNAVRDGDTIFAAFTKHGLNGAGRNPILVRSFDGGQSWDDAIEGTFQDCDMDCSPRIGIAPRQSNGSQKAIHMVWLSQDVNGVTINYARAFYISPGQMIAFYEGPIALVATLPYTSEYSLRAATDGLGYFHIMYIDGAANAYSLRIGEDGGGNAVIEGPVPVGAWAYTTDTATDASGNSYAAIGGVLYKKNYSAAYTATNWSAIGTYDGSGCSDAPSLAVKDANTIFVAHRNCSALSVSITENGGSAWVPFSFGANGRTPQLALTSGGVLNVAYEDVTFSSYMAFSRGSKKGNNWSFSTPVNVLNSRDGHFPNTITRADDKALIIFFSQNPSVVYSTVEQ